MIVPAMTVQEIHQEVFADLKNLKFKLEEFQHAFKKLVLQAKRYAVTRAYDCYTRQKRNLFVAAFTAVKRSNWKDPMVMLYGIYSRPEGKYAVSPSVVKNFVSIYPPHFFARYQERILKDPSLSGEALIREFFLRDWGFLATVVDEHHQSVYYDFEKHDKDDRVSFVAATSQGYCFGERQGDVNIMKTIVSEDMLFKRQRPLFTELKKNFREANKQLFGYEI